MPRDDVDALIDRVMEFAKDDPSEWFAARTMSHLMRMRERRRNPQRNRLYHYTTFAGLEGILRSQKLWASEVSTLNDRSEWKFALEQLDRIFTKATRKHGSKVTAFVASARDYVQWVVGAGVYVICFSESVDSIGMWRGYARSGGGYAIGFDAAELTRIAYGAYDYFVPVLYGNAIFKHHFVEMFDAACADFASRDGIESSFGAYVGAYLITAVAASKHPSFAEEREWRAVFCFNSESFLRRYASFRELASGIGSYVPIGMSGVLGDEDVEESLPIREVIVGPMFAAETSVSTVTAMCEKNGHPSLTVRRSDVPLRS